MSLRRDETEATAAWIASVQLPNGMIPWYPGGHADPWNHVEAAMALVVGGRLAEAQRAMEWLGATQHPDGSWCLYYLSEGVEEPRRDPNVCAYLAAGLWWLYLETGDITTLEGMWPTLERAMRFVLGLQQPEGQVLWSVDPDGTPGRFALLTGSSSIHHSLRCAVAVAELLGHERPEWELAADRLAAAVADATVGGRSELFAAKDRWAMDWYYPVLAGGLQGEAGRSRLAERWGQFVMDGLGVRCVADRPWVTAAETAECAMAHHAVELDERARLLLEWTRHLRDDDGAYWTGCVHPECVRFPGGERSTYTAAAVVLADHVINGRGAASGLFVDQAASSVFGGGELVGGFDEPDPLTADNVVGGR